MGAFGIFMPTLYGEGRHAYRRLQEEIMRRSDDPSLFAWGQVHWGDDYWKVWELGDKFESIFAPSPSAFVAGHDITFADDDPAVSESTVKFQTGIPLLFPSC